MGVALEPNFDKVFTSQEIFRLLLDAMARPGKIVLLPKLDLAPPEGLTRSMAGLAFTLLDRETAFAVLPANEHWSRYLSLNTGSRPRELSRAEFIIADGGADLPEMMEANRGDLIFPERGATLMAMVSSIDEDYGDLKLTLSGPGVPGRKSLFVSGLRNSNLERVKALNREYPLGIDLILSDSRDALVCVPRSNAITREGNA